MKSFVFLLLLSLALFTLPAATAQEPVTTIPPAQQPTIYLCPMHSDVSSKAPGKCPKCNMTLVASTGGATEEFYACPMHPDEMSAKEDNCKKCGMKLKKMAAPVYDDFIIKVETTPKAVVPGRKVKFRFTVFNPKTNEQVRDFNILHDMPFHLFVISQDLTHFDHIHPDKQADSSFTIETVLPKAGPYKIFCDLFPQGGMPQVVHHNLITAGWRGDVVSAQPQLVPDKTFVKVVDGLRFELKLETEQEIVGAPEGARAGRESILRYTIADAKTGQPVTDLKPYLGAWGHTLILDETATEYLHSHPTEMIPEDVDRAKLSGGPEVKFDTFFPKEGTYRIWSQFQRGNKLTTVSFTVHIPRMS